jgi:hypothetical protein
MKYRYESLVKDSDSVKLEYIEKELSLCHIVNHKFQVD